MEIQVLHGPVCTSGGALQARVSNTITQRGQSVKLTKILNPTLIFIELIFLQKEPFYMEPINLNMVLGKALN